MERPLLKLSGPQLRKVIELAWDDFDLMGKVALELQFRSHIGKEQKAEAIARLIELGKAREAPLNDEPAFEFPTTDILETRRNARMGLGDVGWRDVGLLKLSGYQVGITQGRPTRERHRILNFIFLRDTLEDIEDRHYADEWGDPKTSRRLQKLSETLAAFARNGKRSPNNMEQAVSEWEYDLEYLRETFYERWGEFPWPDVEV
jgi:hypothetical protein